MVAFSWVGTPQKGMEIIKFGRHLVEGIMLYWKAYEGIHISRFEQGAQE
jgi:hypothetical protein